MPSVGEENQRGPDHHQRKNADLEHQPREQVENNDRDIRQRAGFAPQQEKNNGAIVHHAKPTEQVRRETELEKPANHRQRVTGRNPYFQRQRPDEPVVIYFGKARIRVHKGELEFENAGCPGRDKAPGTENPPPLRGGAGGGVVYSGGSRRDKNHQETDDADEIIVVQVIRQVNEFGIGEGEEKHDGRKAVKPARHHAQGTGNHEDMEDVEPEFGQCAHPPEAVILEVEHGPHIVVADPAQGHETDGAENHHCPEHDPESDQRGNGYGAENTGKYSAAGFPGCFTARFDYNTIHISVFPK